MNANILLEVTTVVATGFGVWGLVLSRKNGKNGSTPAAPPPVLAPQLVRSLTDLPEKIEQGLAPVLERCFQRLAEARPPAEPEIPEWSVRMAQDLEEIRDNLATEPVWPQALRKSIEALSAQIEATRPPDLEPALVQISNRLEFAVRSIPEPTQSQELTAEMVRGLTEVPERISSRLAEILAAERSRNAPKPSSAVALKASSGSTGGGGGAAGGGGNPQPPSRRAPPTGLPRLAPGAAPATPSIPAPYVGGSVFVPAGEVWNLLALIQDQLSRNCPGTAMEFLVGPDSSNTAPILVGGASAIGGPLTIDNYAYQLDATSPPRIYRSTYPGSNTPVGELQVLASADGYLHVEVQS